MPEQNEKTGVNRVFILEQQVVHPLDTAIDEGQHELRDCGVELDFDGEEVRLTWLGFGPSAFVLPGARQLRKGSWTRVEEGARVSWAGRDWIFLPHRLPGEENAPVRGISLNKEGTGFPANAVLLVVHGKDRGNFYRFRTERAELAPKVTFYSKKNEDKQTLKLELGAQIDDQLVRLDGEALAPGSSVDLRSDQLISIAAHDRGPAITVMVIEA